MNNKKSEIDNSNVHALEADEDDKADQAGKFDQVKGHMKEALLSPSIAKCPRRLLDFPSEIRNNIYEKVIEDIPRSINFNHPVGDSTLRQPALAKVNRQLRREVLPIWYKKKTFGICIFPKRHSEADQVWQDFVGPFRAHTAGADGSHYLSCIRRLQVELWHPAFSQGFSLDRMPGWIPARGSHRIYEQTGLFSSDMSNGIYLYFGAFDMPSSPRVGDINTDWTDRAAVRTLLHASIVEDRGGRYPDRLERFWETFPFDRLVDLVMMIADECKEAARSVHIVTSFAPLNILLSPAFPPPVIENEWSGSAAPDRLLGDEAFVH